MQLLRVLTAATLYRRDIVQINCRMQRVKRWEKAVCNTSEMITDSNNKKKKKKKALEVNMQLIWLATY